MKSKHLLFLGMIALISTILLSSCGHKVKNIPAGTVAKKLTPTGWDKGILEAGQVDLGADNGDDTYTSLVLLEVTDTTIKEQFMQTDPKDKQDHRVRTKDGTPLIVDFYIQTGIPADEQLRNGIFATSTPVATDQDRVSKITIESVYNKFARQMVRGKTREIFAEYENADDVMHNFGKISAEISKMLIDVVNELHIPIIIRAAQLSNVKEDDEILQSKNKLVAASNEAKSIAIIGQVLRDNPQYLESKRLDVLEKIGTTSRSNLVVMDTKGTTTLAIPTK